MHTENLTAHLTDNVHLGLFHYWSEKHRGQGLPAWVDLDPAEIPHLLPYVGLIDVVRGAAGSPATLRYKQIGEYLNAFFGRDYAGAEVSAAAVGPLARYFREICEIAVETGRPVYSETDFLLREGMHLFGRRLVLPLATDGTHVDLLLFSTLFDLDGELDQMSGPLVDHIVASEEITRRIAA